MKSLLLLLALTLCGCAGAGDAAPNAAPETAASKPTRVLFVGNSFTFWRGGLWKHLEILSAAMEPALGYEGERVVRGGACLEVMWKRTRAREVIAEGRWDVVVLQGDIPETTVASFKEYSRRFVAAVRDVGARPVLFMAWDYERLGWLSMGEIAAAHRAMSDELKVDVAPVGLAWQESARRRPDVDMYGGDREHPSVAGMYLSLVTIEGVISGADPRTRRAEALPIRGLGRVPATDMQHLREVAADAIAQWTAGDRVGEDLDQGRLGRGIAAPHAGGNLGRMASPTRVPPRSFSRRNICTPDTCGGWR
jgi:hypothetical protein